MRRLLFALLASSLAACGGGGGGGSGDSGSGGGATAGGVSGDGRLPPAVPTVAVNGSAVDGLILQGTVRAYSFVGGAKGALLGSTQTDNAGHYSLNIQAETMPILLEVTGGHYKEEADAKDVRLSPSDVMTALANFQTGVPITMAITPWTHVAAALARYKISNGGSVSSAISTSNAEVSAVVGVNITSVIPADVTDSSNVTGAVSDAIKYGWMSAAISQWTLEHGPTDAALQHVYPYTSIALVQSMYDDVLNDGVLDGHGPTGQIMFNQEPLGIDIYRYEFAAMMLKFAGNANNATTLTPGKIFPVADIFRQNNGGVFAAGTIKPFQAPTFDIRTQTTNGYMRGSAYTILTGVQDITGVYRAVLSVDGATPTVREDGSSSVSGDFAIDSTALSDGPHNVEIEITNGANLVTKKTMSIISDNTPPSYINLSNVRSANLPFDKDVLGGGYLLWPTSVGCRIQGMIHDDTSGMARIDLQLFLQDKNHTPAGQASLLFAAHPTDYSDASGSLRHSGGMGADGRGGYAEWGLALYVSPSIPLIQDWMEFDLKATWTDSAGNSAVINTTQGIYVPNMFNFEVSTTGTSLGLSGRNTCWTRPDGVSMIRNP